eukprot:3515951-Prymnesium_polylepis.1
MGDDQQGGRRGVPGAKAASCGAPPGGGGAEAPKKPGGGMRRMQTMPSSAVSKGMEMFSEKHAADSKDDTIVTTPRGRDRIVGGFGGGGGRLMGLKDRMM